MNARREARAAADPGLAVRKARDTALAVPLAGAILLMPPVAQIFAIDGRILGVPIAVAYVLGVWLALIVAARRTGRWILDSETGAEAGIGAAGPAAGEAEARGGR